jgi:phosphate-selective porin
VLLEISGKGLVQQIMCQFARFNTSYQKGILQHSISAGRLDFGVWAAMLLPGDNLHFGITTKYSNFTHKHVSFNNAETTNSFSVVS